MRDVYEERLSANRDDESSATQRVDGISGSAGAKVESCVLVGVDSLLECRWPPIDGCFGPLCSLRATSRYEGVKKMAMEQIETIKM